MDSGPSGKASYYALSLCAPSPNPPTVGLLPRSPSTYCPLDSRTTAPLAVSTQTASLVCATNIPEKFCRFA